jgi:hypothetical protein
MFLSILSSQGQDDKEPTWQETVDFVARTIEQHGSGGCLSGAYWSEISNVTINAKNLSYYEVCRYSKDWPKLAKNGVLQMKNDEWTRIVSFPLDKLDVSTIKAAIVKDWITGEQVFSVQFFCLEDSCVESTSIHRVETDNGQFGEPEGTTDTLALKNYRIRLTDEDAMNRLARALKHLAILAGSPSKELFTH